MSSTFLKVPAHDSGHKDTVHTSGHKDTVFNSTTTEIPKDLLKRIQITSDDIGKLREYVMNTLEKNMKKKEDTNDK